MSQPIAITPVRVHRSRQNKLESPNGLPIVCCTRGTKWGNPYKVGAPHPLHGMPMTRDEVIALHRRDVEASPELQVAIRAELRGKNLACWCSTDQTCHCDVLLDIANG